MVTLAAVLGGTGVALGAFAAHGLESRLTADRLATFETGARYQLVHALAVLGAAGLRARLSPGSAAATWLGRAASAWGVGALLFSGSLYALSISGLRWLGAVTPLGGVAFLAGWAMLLVAAARMRGESWERTHPS